MLDEMISPRVAWALREAGHDVVAVAEEAGLRALPDDVLLDMATAERRVLVTRNVADFANLDQLWHEEGRPHHGIVMITQRAFPSNKSFVGALTTALLASKDALYVASHGTTVYLRMIGAESDTARTSTRRQSSYRSRRPSTD